ncbi:methyltransferase, FkbM family [Noviherbaspirillum humi]|uniref:Methyltransferase, FkbM family n=1 Tax=Noviherbaspirillum humi TaxID=1688639 RepID=A0A239LPS9_9BURK|nr:FkbM family methyltransferase [Noviherbaspirillum humi]SNT32280.1 methyltransferase, FkbM family [Noviherbaspirillum humi]
MNHLPRRPAAFVLASTNHGSMLVNRHDYRLLPEGGYGVGFQLLNAGCFDPEEVNSVMQLLLLRREHFGAGVVALDCGANVGVHTLEWARLMHGWGQVLAFEAQERIFYALAGNIALNNCFNARAFWAAIGGQTGAIRAPQPNYFIPSSFGSVELRRREHNEFIGQDLDYGDDRTQEVRMLALDDLQLERLDFLKLDIEGMEFEALEGGRATLQKCRPQLLVEKIKTNEADLRGMLQALDYQVFELGINLLAVHESDPAAAQIKVA